MIGEGEEIQGRQGNQTREGDGDDRGRGGDTGEAGEPDEGGRWGRYGKGWRYRAGRGTRRGREMGTLAEEPWQARTQRKKRNLRRQGGIGAGEQKLVKLGS